MTTAKAPPEGGGDAPAVPRGPRKKAPLGPPAQRVTLHKARAAWFGARVTWPLREAPLRALERERARASRSLPAARVAQRWTMAGPTNIGGRCTALVCDPLDSDRVWIGAAGGGVWASSDAGLSWAFKWRASGPLQIGSLAIDPARSKTLYCGTGEANLSADSYPGNGVYRSSNGGSSWRLWASCEKAGVPRRIGCVAVDPFDSAHVLVGGVGFGRMSSDNEFVAIKSLSRCRNWPAASHVPRDSSEDRCCRSAPGGPKAGVDFPPGQSRSGLAMTTTL